MIFHPIKRAIKPFRLTSMIAMYFLGAGLVQYIQSLENWSAFIEGLIFLVSISISLELLMQFYELKDVKHWPEGITFREVKMTRWVILILTATLMTTATVIFIDWQFTGVLWLGLSVLVVSLILLSLFYYFSMSWRDLQPYQPLIEGLIYIVLPPAFAYFLQSRELHSFLTLSVISFVPVYLAFKILVQIQQFPADQKTGKNTIIIRLGWNKAMVAHNALILLTFVGFALIVLLGFPWFLLWPVFLVLPIGLLEIWLMERVKGGSKPFWLVMKIATASVLFIPLYLLSFAFWIR